MATIDSTKFATGIRTEKDQVIPFIWLKFPNGIELKLEYSTGNTCNSWLVRFNHHLSEVCDRIAWFDSTPQQALHWGYKEAFYSLQLAQYRLALTQLRSEGLIDEEERSKRLSTYMYELYDEIFGSYPIIKTNLFDD